METPMSENTAVVKSPAMIPPPLQGPDLIDVEKLPAETAAAKLLGYAIEHNASDLFIVPSEQTWMVQIRYLGMVRPVSVLSGEQGRRLITHIKAASGMDLSERRRPLDGRWIHTDDEGGNWDLRISTIPTAFGEDVAIRMFARDKKQLTLKTLGLADSQLVQLQGMLNSPGGLVLFTGPSGSGKTVSIYSCLSHLNDGKKKINTIEDPIEYILNGVRQSQIHPAINVGFSDLLRAVMRQNPDVIMVGEIRDHETADTAIRAANSGHLVLATIHAVSAAAAVQSMLALDVRPHFLSTCLRGVIAQRLVRTLCPTCRRHFDVSDAPHTFDDVKSHLAPGEGNTLFVPRGCPTCLSTGYANRTGVFEIMSVTRSLRQLIADAAEVRQLRDQAHKEGMLEFRQSALLKVAKGLTSLEEIFRAIPSEQMAEEG
jgi:type II secretory ATPase GspE/PulE/Tfp pilus assembly ATPase PilB-like protein